VQYKELTEVLSPAFYLEPDISSLNLTVARRENTESLILLGTYISQGSNR